MRLAFWRRRRDRGGGRVPAWTVPAVFYPAVGERPRPEPAVSIGFRDGSTVDVEPDSPQGRALLAAADILVHGHG